MNESQGRARSAYPGYWPLACGECHLEIFRLISEKPGSHYRLYTDSRGRLWGEPPNHKLVPLEGAVVCVSCEEMEKDSK